MRSLYLMVVLLCMPSVSIAMEPRMLPTQNGGWNGADAAYNHLLPNQKRLWVFGDTLVGKVAENQRVAPLMYRNSLGVQGKTGGMRYYWGEDEQGAFTNKRDGEWYWPADFVLLDKVGYFFLRRIHETDPADVMGFAVAGTDVAVVENVTLPPSEWNTSYISISRDGSAVGVAAAADKDYVYLLANDAADEHAFYLARMSRLAMKEQLLVLTYFNPRYKKWQGSAPHRPIIAKGAPEASLAWDEQAQHWRLIYSEAGLSPNIVQQTAKKITGAWSPPELLYRCPEAEQKDIICYAGKEVEGTVPMDVTYSVNSLVPADLEADATLYIPRLIAPQTK